MFEIDLRSSAPIYEQIVNKIKEAVVKGYLKPMDSLPSVRKLATMLNVNPNTIAKAYQELERQHVIITIRGKGTFIDENNSSSYVDLDIYLDKLRPIITEMLYSGLTKQDINLGVKTIFDELEGKEEEK